MNQERNRIVADVVKNLEQVFDPEMPSVSVIHLGLILMVMAFSKMA